MLRSLVDTAWVLRVCLWRSASSLAAGSYFGAGLVLRAHDCTRGVLNRPAHSGVVHLEPFVPRPHSADYEKQTNVLPKVSSDHVERPGLPCRVNDDLHIHAHIEHRKKLRGSANEEFPSGSSGADCVVNLVARSIPNGIFLHFPEVDGLPISLAMRQQDPYGYNLLPTSAKSPIEFSFANTTHAFRCLSDMLNYGNTLRVKDCSYRRPLRQEGSLSQEIGPFSSMGGYDFWVAFWDDVGRFKKLAHTQSESIYITSYRWLVLDSAGQPLPLPPIHFHHAQAGLPQNGSSFPANISFHIDGDQQCLPDQGGVGCFTRDLPSGYGIAWKDAIRAYVEINDVRVKGSAFLDWHIHVSLDWVSRGRGLKAISVVLFINIQFGQWPSIASVVSTDRPSFFFYSAQMPACGKTILHWTHTHVAVLSHMYFFASSPEQIGMSKFRGRFQGKAIDLAVAGFPSIGALERYVFHHFWQSIAKSNAASEGLGVQDHVHSQPALICNRSGIEEDVGGFLYDRAPPIREHCSPWAFRAGDNITGLIINKVLNPRSLSIEGVRNRAHLPMQFSQHLEWYMYYAADDGEVHNDAAFLPVTR